ncbi:MAG: flagellar protein FlgN [Methylococcaceae bacterium]
MINQTFPIAERLATNGLMLIAQLQQLLNDEAELLKTGAQITEINAIVEKKQPLIYQLNQFSRQMAQVLTTETLPNDQNGMLQYLEKAKATGLTSDNMRQLWTDIIQTTQHCQDLNEQNGASIDILRRHTQRSLYILKGNTQAPNTYGKDGSAKRELHSHTLISV